MEIDFKNKVALVTGATRGLGKQIADDFYDAGADLILTGTNANTINRLNNDLKGRGVKNVRYLTVDFAKDESMNDFLGELGKYSKIDVCINNAGVNKINYIYDCTEPDWNYIVDVNLKAPFRIIQEVSKLMKKNGYGRIVNIASIFGVISREKRSIYSSSKSGLVGLTRAAAVDLAPNNILANSVSPGFVLTELTKSILSQAEIDELTSIIPSRRMAVPEDISKVVLFLSSDLNTYIAGQNIIVDGAYVNV